MSSKEFLVTGVASVFVLFAAGCLSNNVGPGSPETKSVALPDSLSWIPVSSLSTRHRRGTAAAGPVPECTALAKTTAKVDPAKIEVLVVNMDWDVPEEVWTKSNEFSTSFWENASRDMARWSDQLDYYTTNPYENLVFYGALQRNGDYASGTVDVKHGINSVLVGFVMPDGMVHNRSVATAEYYWGMEEHEDGWYDMTTYTYEDTLFQTPDTGTALQ